MYTFGYNEHTIMLRNLKGIIILEISNIFETRLLTMVAHYLRVQFFQNCTTLPPGADVPTLAVPKPKPKL